MLLSWSGCTKGCAIATVYATLQGLDVQQQQQQRRRIDIHWDRGLSFLKIGLRWIRGAVYQGAAVVDELAIARIFTSPS